MKTKPLFLYLTFLIGAGLHSFSHAGVNLSFSQVDYYNNGSLVEANSEWGQIDISYDQSPELQWLNILSNPGTQNQSWIGQNIPLLPSPLTGSASFSSSIYFDLGGLNVTRGQDIFGTSTSMYYEITATPSMTTPNSGGSGVTAAFSFGDSENIINSGVPTGLGTLNAGSSSGIDWNVPFLGLDVIWHGDMPNVTQESNFCGPGAAANSLHWLDQEHNLGLPSTITNTMKELAVDMGNNHDGNWDDAEVSGKLKYLADNSIDSINTHYTGGAMLPQTGDFTDPNGNGVGHNDGPISWDWIVDQMRKGQDVELMTGSHWVVLEGLVSWDGVNLIGYRDDPYQHGENTTPDEQKVIDARHVWTYFKDGDVNIGNGKEGLRAVVAESVPDSGPSFGQLTASVAVIFLFGKRRVKQRISH